MVNRIKSIGSGLGLQVTKPVRAAGLVEEQGEGEDRRTTYRADVLIHVVDGIVLVIDVDLISGADRAALVSRAIRSTRSTYTADFSQIQHAGNGYRVQLPGVRHAGLEKGDRAPVQTDSGVLVVHREDKTLAGRAEDILA
jgi:hypothetical protein